MIKNIIETINANSTEITTILDEPHDSKISSLVAEVSITSSTERRWILPDLETTEQAINTNYFYDAFLNPHVRFELVLWQNEQWNTIATFPAVNRGAPYQFPLTTNLTDAFGYLWIEGGRPLGVRLLASHDHLAVSDRISIFGHAVVEKDDFTVFRTLEEPKFSNYQWLTIASKNSQTSREAIDGNPNTAWSTTGNGEEHDFFEVNLGVVRPISKIIVEPRQNNADIEVFTSTSGARWQQLIGDWIDIDPHQFVMGNVATKYIRLELRDDMNTPWRIENFQIF